MSINMSYDGPEDLPTTIPVFPLDGALLLPRGEMPLNVFEPRYVQMIDDALRGDRLIGMVQPEGAAGGDASRPGLYGCGCVGRLTAFGESGDGRYLVTLTGVARYRIAEELEVDTPYRQCRVDFEPFRSDFEPGEGEDDVDRDSVVRTLRNFAKAHELTVDWRGIDGASNEALVNALSMMSPFGAREKQALLEAADLKSRAEVLIAIAEIELARREGDSAGLQ
ncbi:LON peptidase substrate-binding domain-containing protein [Lichenihabitans sp. Uapishka_5]|uniref:LON peptidase substrate-binding domain-containing protein n=1 Tax=Lichenihabitans sp. Uapishka_5 TaxID=3037302 RepID=UPI0029E7EF34|nr:LON peptidase substrate-binding domain-containing protein [Lichenihabitans sp. Uapishka_5]MDX7951596.1 LON peptidase substrate-binding domain-containing protein [Lichenihabitans sp. Uapishka_5]